jgi:acetyl esterase/lipase
MKHCSNRLHFLWVVLFFSMANPTLSPANFAANETITYKTVGDVELALHVFYPPGHQSSDSRPAIVFFFGGGWTGGSPTQFYPHCAYFASRGMVTMAAEYRTRNSHGTTPRESVKDGKSAIRWIRQHAARLGVDPGQVLAGGGSAGGHVAAAAATLQKITEPTDDLSISSVAAALVLFNPVFDNGPTGYGYDRVQAYWQDFSPMHNLHDQTPPTIVFLGTEDHLIPVATAQQYQRMMQELGRPCDLHLYEGQGHGFFNFGRGDSFPKTMLETDRFLVRLGYLEGEPTVENFEW